jgi:hypothetical protein
MTPELEPSCIGDPRGCYECIVRRATAREKFGREDKSAQMYSAFRWRVALLARMSCARVCPFKTRRSLKTIRNTRLRTRRCDCSFVVTYPVQTSIGSLRAVVVVWEMYGPPHDCKQNRHRGWFGLLKCIRPVRGAKLLAIMESARRWSIKWVELNKGSHSHAGLNNAGCDRSPTH